MTVEFSCPECDKAYALPATLAGKMARCKQCQTVMIVPGVVEPEPVAEASPSQPRKSPRPKKTRAVEPDPEPEPDDPFGVEDLAPLPPRREEPALAAVPPRSTGKASSRSSEAWGANFPRLGFVHAVLGWAVVMSGLLALAFVVEDGAFKSAQLMFWLGIVLVPTASLWFLATAFLESFTTGLLVLFVPFYSIYHLFRSWSETYRPFWTGVAAVASIAAGITLYNIKGDDVGERALLSFPGSAGSRRVVVDERELPLRPPEIAKDLSTEAALERWKPFFEDLRSNLRLAKVVNLKRQRMIRDHGREALLQVKINNVLDGATFDSVAQRLRPFAGPGVDDFFAYPVIDSKRTTAMVVLLSPVADRSAVAQSIDFGLDKVVSPKGDAILVQTSPDGVPDQLKSLFDADPDEASRLAKLGRPADSGATTSTSTSTVAARPAPPSRALDALPSTGDLELPYPPCPGGYAHTLFPTANSRYVAIGENGSTAQSRESWDLKERRRIGLISTAIPSAHGFKLSPEGTALAAISAGMQAVEVWSFETGQLVRRIDVNTIVDWVDFAGPGQVVIGTPFQNTFYVAEIATGRLVKTVVSPVSVDRGSLSVDANGLRLALAASGQKSAGVYSLETARLIANWPVPPAQPYASMSCQGMTFSSDGDGNELAGLFEDSKFARFLAWGSGGKVLDNALVPLRTPESVAKPPSYQGRALEWLPDRSGWLVYGRGVVDRRTGKLAWTIPTPPDASKIHPRRISDDGDLFYVGGTSPKPILKSLKLPLEEIRRAIQAVRSAN